MQLPCRKGPGTHWAPSAALLSAAATCFKRRYSKLDVPPTTTSQILASNLLANNTVVFQAVLNAGASLMRAAAEVVSTSEVPMDLMAPLQ